jgi:hypothetical protein
MSEINEALEKIRGLYEATGCDWRLDVKFILTEPVCPQAVIYPEGWMISRYRCYANSIDEAICRAANAVYREVIMRQSGLSFGHLADLNDECYAEWIEARIAGNNDKLPEEKW